MKIRVVKNFSPMSRKFLYFVEIKGLFSWRYIASFLTEEQAILFADEFSEKPEIFYYREVKS